MENEIKSVLDIIAEISKKDKKKQVFILTNLINQLKSTRIEANEGSNFKAIAKRRKRNKNKKTHRNAKR